MLGEWDLIFSKEVNVDQFRNDFIIQCKYLDIFSCQQDQNPIWISVKYLCNLQRGLFLAILKGIPNKMRTNLAQNLLAIFCISAICKATVPNKIYGEHWENGGLSRTLEVMSCKIPGCGYIKWPLLEGPFSPESLEIQTNPLASQPSWEGIWKQPTQPLGKRHTKLLIAHCWSMPL